MRIDGEALEIIEVPMPRRVVREDLVLPMSYANFYIANTVVLAPIYGEPNDDIALSVLREQFPGRRVIGIDCRELIWGLGAFHCLTQQQPAIA
jgi:agmatine deiminase